MYIYIYGMNMDKSSPPAVPYVLGVDLKNKEIDRGNSGRQAARPGPG